MGGWNSGSSKNKPTYVTNTDGPINDAFGRIRTSSPYTIFDSKQIFDNAPLFWDDQEVSGSGTGSSHDVDTASSEMTVSNTTAGKRVRQTFMCFNYQPGKSQLILLTGVIGTGGTGITSCIGQLDDDNGLFFKNDEGTLKVVRRTNVTGSAVDNEVSQISWNLDPLNGNGASKITLDLSKTQIFVIDYEWLGVGRVRMGLNIGGETYYCHEFNNANQLSEVYISSPNLPLRYSIENDGTGVASTLKHICTSVTSEGGVDDNGVLQATDNHAAHLDANASGTRYACVGIRLKTANLGASIKPVFTSVLAVTNDDFHWEVMFNPTVAGTFTYNDKANSSVQEAIGATANTVTGGDVVASGFSAHQTETAIELNSARMLGAAIDGTRDTYVLVVTPLSSNADIYGSLNWRELV